MGLSKKEQDAKVRELSTESQKQKEQIDQQAATIKKNLDEHQATTERLKSENATQAATMKKAVDDLAMEKTRADAETKKVQDMEKAFEASKKEVIQLQDKIVKQETEKKQLSDDLYKSQGTVQEAQKGAEPAKAAEAKLQAAIKDLESQLKKSEASVIEMQASKEASEQQLNTDLKKERETISGMTNDVNILQASVKETQDKLAIQVAESNNTLQDMLDKITGLEADVDERTTQLQEAEDARNGHSELKELVEAGGIAMGASADGHVGYSEKLAKGLAIKVLDLEEELHKKSQALVEKGEEHVALHGKFQKSAGELRDAKIDVSSGRELLLKGIAGDHVDEKLYKHVPLEELVRLRLKAAGLGMDNSVSLNGTSMTSDTDANVSMESEAGSQVEGQVKMDKQNRKLAKENKELRRHIEQLESDLVHAKTAVDSLKVLSDKTHELASRQRSEKDARHRSELATKQSNEKVVALSEHIEKLMIHLKHEAAAKAKINDLQRRTEKEVAMLRTRNKAIQDKNTQRERVIKELKEGSKILEDQLRLMDEKYIELRAKLDWTRASSQKEMKRVTAEANSLRAKWALAVENGSMNVSESPFNTGKKMGGSKSMSVLGGGGKSKRGMPELPSATNQRDSLDAPWSETQMSTSMQRNGKREY